ncbi:V-type ATP synthase subunit I [[Eubacterium] cellulosolvens]
MLYPARMKEVTIIVHEYYITDLINILHETGLIEITEVAKSGKDYSGLLSPGKSHEETIKCISYNLRINRILDILDRVAPEPEGLFKSFTRPEPRPKFTIKRKNTQQLFLETEKVFKQIEDKVLEIDSQLNSLEEQLSELKHQKDQIRLLRPIRFNLGYLGASKHLIIKAGMVDSVEQLKKALKDMKDVTYRYAESDEKYSVVIAAHISQKAELENRLRGRFFTEFDISGFQGTPEEVMKKLNTTISSLESRKKKFLEILKKLYSAWHNKLLILDEELDNEKQQKEVFGRFGETRHTKLINGWVLSKNQPRLEKVCSDATHGHAKLSYRDPKLEEEGNVPVKLENPKWAKPFEVLTTLFATPRYNEIDPTLLIMIPFIFFFGLMLGDAGYGFVILILCLFGYFHLGKIRPVVKQASYIGIFMGISTIIFGLLMGSVFGDLIPRLIYKDPGIPLYKAEILGFHLPYDPIRSPVFLLQISLIIGVSYIMMSIIAAAGHNIKYRKAKDLFLSQVSWFILVPFGLVLIFYAFFKFNFNSLTLNLSYLMIILGLLLLIVDKRGLFFFDITGYLGDTLSFARLLALGLATAGIAMTINIIAELVLPIHPVIVILVLILLFFGHLINFVLQALGAGIHSLRLQYVEFFSRCYEGGGNQYQPFRAKRIITKLEPKK